MEQIAFSAPPFLVDGYGYGYGYGYGSGSGSGSGSGYGDGDGYGSGDGYGDGSGSGYGYGYGYGYGSGSGDGYGSGSGSGSGSGYGYGDEESSSAYYAALAGGTRQDGAVLALWRSTAKGLPANGGKLPTPVKVGDIHEAPGPLNLCHSGTLHATFRPDKWKGERWWIVALHGEIAVADDKLGALKREIVAELTDASEMAGRRG